MINELRSVFMIFLYRKREAGKRHSFGHGTLSAVGNFAMREDRIGGMGMENIIKECGKYGEDTEYTVYKRYI